MLIEIEASIIFYFMLFMTIIITPILYYLYSLFSKTLAFKHRTATINQCVGIYRENKDLFANIGKSIHNIIHRIEQHFYHYKMENSPISRFKCFLKKFCKPLFLLAHQYFNNENSQINTLCASFKKNYSL